MIKLINILKEIIFKTPIGQGSEHIIYPYSKDPNKIIKTFDPDETESINKDQITTFQKHPDIFPIIYKVTDKYAVLEKLSEEDVRPLTDQVSVQIAEIVNYSVEAVITVYSGPSSAVVETEARAALDKFLDERHAIEKLVAVSGIYDALHVDGVKKVQLIHPTSDVVTTDEQAAYCNSKTISIVVDE